MTDETLLSHRLLGYAPQHSWRDHVGEAGARKG